MKETFAIKDQITTLATEARTICRVCQKQFSKYTCPRCNNRHCSLQCYKNHSLHCTESFSRENVEEEMRQMRPEEETKKKMLEILKRFHFEEVEEERTDCLDDQVGSVLSEEIIQNVLSGKQVNLEDLSPEEMNRLQRAIASGELSKMIAPWPPWWRKPSAKFICLSSEGSQLIRPVHNAPESYTELESDIPQGPASPLKAVGELIHTEPSPHLAIHLLDIMYSYCFVLRLYNGEWMLDASGASMVILSISGVLGDGSQPETAGEALMGCLQHACSPSYRHIGGAQFGLSVLEDVAALLFLGGDALICALCSLQRLVQCGIEEMKTAKKERCNKGKRKMLRIAERKIYFFMCWVHEQTREMWSSLAVVVGTEKELFAVGSSVGHKGEIARDASLIEVV